MSDDLSACVLAAQAGDMEAFGLLVERFQRVALARAYGLLGDFHLAQDVVQETFWDAYRALPGLRSPAAFPAWLRTIVRKHADRQTRGRRAALVSLEAGPELLNDGPDPPAAVEQHESAGLVRAAIDGLPERERNIVALFYLAGLSTQELSEGLGLPLTTVKKRLFDARRRLRERMHAMVDDELRRPRPWDDRRFSATVQLLVAVRAGNLAEVRARLAADPQLAQGRASREEGAAHGLYTPIGGFTPLFEAVTGGSRAMVAAILDAGADLQAQPLLHEAAIRGHAEVAALLLERGAAVDRPTRNGQTALHWAVIRGRRDLARLLLERGANPDTPSNHGRTPLHWAAIQGDRAAAELLLAHGAQRDRRDAAGLTPSLWAARRGHAALAATLSDQQGEQP